MLPDTARSSTSRPDVHETAAYAASQPLFDVLRGAISRLEEQKIHLNGAKDTVQHLHVKVPQEHIENNGTLRTDYKDALVAAWKSMTESYVRIFEQLCEITGPDVAAGREAEESYPGFQKLLYTAEAARTVAFERDAESKRNASTSSEDESSDPETTTPKKNSKQAANDVASSKRTAGTEPSSSESIQRPAKKQRTLDVRVEDGTADKPKEQPTINTVQRLKPKQIRKERKRRNQLAQQSQPEQQQAAMPPPTINEPQQSNESIPQAQYEDVSAEVDARLRAREEQKKAKKSAKKRKRDSQGSHVLEAEPGAEKEAMQAREAVLAQKPAKKKSRSDSGDGLRVDGEKKNVPAKGKRGNEDAQDGQGGAEEGAEARRSKRKKT